LTLAAVEDQDSLAERSGFELSVPRRVLAANRPTLGALFSAEILNTSAESTFAFSSGDPATLTIGLT
jgi:hypothetical protein